MLNLRLRRYSASGVRGAVIPHALITATLPESASSVIDFSVSEQVAGTIELPQIVGLEVQHGNRWIKPRNDLFVIDKRTGDGTDASRTWTYRGENIVSWFFRQYAIWWAEGFVFDGKRIWSNDLPGRIIRQHMREGQGYAPLGWAPMLSTGFTDTQDSFGQSWSQRVSEHYQIFTTPFSQVLNAMVTNGKAEWWSEGTKLHMSNPGVGTVRPNVKLGIGASAAPIADEFDVFTSLIVQHDGGWSDVQNNGADRRFGALYRIQSQSGAPNVNVARDNAAPVLLAGRAVSRQLSFDYDPTLNGPFPHVDFLIGDTVKVRSGDSWEPRRVVGMVLTNRPGSAPVRVTCGDRILSPQSKIAKQAAAATVGQIIGGNGDGVPVGVRPSDPLPSEPESLRTTTNVGEWRPDGSAAARVGIAWNPVTRAVDGGGVTVTGYEVWARLPNGSSSRVTTVENSELEIDSWAPGELRLVKVRALSRQGAGAFTPEISVTPATPVSIVPLAPTGLRVAANTGSFGPDGSARAEVTLRWDAITASVEGALVTVPSYELWEGTEEDPGHSVVSTTGTSATLQWPSSTTRVVRVRGISDTGVWGDLSTPVEVIPALPPTTIAAPTKPTLATSSGIVAVSWDGKLGGAAPGSGFRRVRAQYRVDSGSWTEAATFATASGQVATVRGTVGTTVQARLIAEDTLGRVSAASSTASVVVAGVGNADLSKAIQDAIIRAGEQADKSAQDAADALTKVEKAIQSSLDEYLVNDSSVTPPPADAAWDSDTPDWKPGQYVWRRTKNTHIDGSVTYSAPAVITGADGTAGEDAVLLRVSSSRGTSFKNNSISTVLTVTVFKGSQQITDIEGLWAAFGSSAYLEWKWRRIDDSDFGVISSADTRLSQSGFAFTVSPAEVDEQTVFQCILQTPNP